MNWNFLPDFLSLFPLAWAAYLIMGERHHFHSLVPFMAGVLLLFIGRLSDVIIALPLNSLSGWPGFSARSFNLVVNGLGNLCDAIGALFLVVGFVKTIAYQRQEEKRIQNLEALLPICAWCKSYRTPDGVWKPIEAYLVETGGPPITHGICPICAEKRLRGVAQPRAR